MNNLFKWLRDFVPETGQPPRPAVDSIRIAEVLSVPTFSLGSCGGTSTPIDERKESFQHQADLLVKQEVEKIIRSQPQQLSEFQDEHKRDCAMYFCTFTRIKDFLQIHVVRAANSDSNNTRKLLINLSVSQPIELVEGMMPNLSNSIHVNHSKEGQYPAPQVSSNADYINHSQRGLIFVKEPLRPGSGGAGGLPSRMLNGTIITYSHCNIATVVTVPNCARPAVDDCIKFGPDITLSIPAGMGSSVYANLLKVLGENEHD